MTTTPAESKMDFDYSVSTEDRFNLRKWFEEFIESQNNEELDEQKHYLSEQLIVEGFLEDALNREGYLYFIKEQKEKGNITQIRYPEVKVKFKDDSFFCSGTFEALAGSVFSYEGTIEIEVMAEENNFSVDFIKFYPRLKMTT